MLKTRRICNPYGRSKVVPVILVKRDAGFAADKLLRCHTGGLAAWCGGWLEEISESRNTVQVTVFRLDRQAIRDGGNTHVVPAYAIAQRKIAFHAPLVLHEQRKIFFVNCP